MIVPIFVLNHFSWHDTERRCINGATALGQFSMCGRANEADRMAPSLPVHCRVEFLIRIGDICLHIVLMY
jgi:hypothetical protein